MEPAAALAWQPSLFDDAEPALDVSFRALVRYELDEDAWVDHVPGWLSGSDELFAWVLRNAEWHGRDRPMYGRMVTQPRLTAHWPYEAGVAELPAPLEAMRASLSARYAKHFDAVGANLYRDGRDSVAWHGDRIAKEIHNPIVATVSLGDRRRFLLRPRGGGRSRVFDPGKGDLLVMGGSCQRTWEHTVPKVAMAGPRISITLRHSA